MEKLVEMERKIQLRNHESNAPTTGESILFCRVYEIYKLRFNELKLKAGISTKVEISHSGETSNGVVVKTLSKNTLAVQIREGSTMLIPNGKHSLHFPFNEVPFDRMYRGLKAFRNGNIDTFIRLKILGMTEEDLDFIKDEQVRQRINSYVSTLDANNSQKEAIKHAVKKKFTLVQGPPGTGKSTTIAMIVSVIKDCSISDGKIIVAAPSNVAANHLAGKLRDRGVNVVRLISYAKENIESDVSDLYTKNICKRLNPGLLDTHYKYLGLFLFFWLPVTRPLAAAIIIYFQRTRLARPSTAPIIICFQKLYRKYKNYLLTRKAREAYFKRRKAVEDEVIDKAQVICCTFSGSFDYRLKNVKFIHVILDEVSQATEPETILPILKGSKQVIMLGDQNQLGPTVISSEASQAGLGKSLFHRLCESRNSVMLAAQYRMHPAICAFPSEEFYGGKLENKISALDRPMKQIPGLNWPNPEKPIMFIRSLTGTKRFNFSYYNSNEIRIISRLLKCLLNGGIKPTEIGVITPYSAQNIKLKEELEGSLDEEVLKLLEIQSVDGFQGREKEYMIFSCVRSSGYNGIGFLDRENRLNVAITRARSGFIICGNDIHLSKNPMWERLVNHYKKHRALVEHPYSTLEFLNSTN